MGKKNDYTNSNGSLKKEIYINEFVEIVSKKLIEKRLKERSSKGGFL